MDSRGDKEQPPGARVEILCLSRCDRYAPRAARRARASARRSEQEQCMLRESEASAQDQALVTRVMDRDPLALQDFLRRLGCIPIILRVRNRRMGNPLDEASLDDLAQETLVAIWQKLDEFRGASSLESWVYRFCVHKHLALVRNRGRRAGIETVDGALVDGARAPFTLTEIDDERLHHSLAELDDRRASILRLKHYDDLTFDEIGTRLSLSPNTVKTHYYRALKSMRDSLVRQERRGP